MAVSKLQVRKAGQDENLVLANLMNHYFYDMAEWFEINAAQDLVRNFATMFGTHTTVTGKYACIVEIVQRSHFGNK